MLHHFYMGNLQDSDSYLDILGLMDVGYAGEPFVCGQVNLTGRDADINAMDIGYAGEPFVRWTNIT